MGPSGPSLLLFMPPIRWELDSILTKYGKVTSLPRLGYGKTLASALLALSCSLTLFALSGRGQLLCCKLCSMESHKELMSPANNHVWELRSRLSTVRLSDETTAQLTLGELVRLPEPEDPTELWLESQPTER